ncbi:MAG: type II toxin-antitoxin system PemK/MazF family toxin [Proteobacteria bacterium]|nr:type II toxin-antitoxin system PemK/MazF family toxin [Pseudomonadota bacterium]
MMRGTLVTVALQGDYGKPRPAVVIQSDLFDEHPSVTVLPLTTELRDTPLFRIDVEPSPDNGLQKRSQIMIDKIHTVPRSKLGSMLGKLSDDEQIAVNRSLMLFLGLA